MHLLSDVSYGNDSAFVATAGASDIAAAAGRACHIIQGVFDSRRLPMNVAPGKSEVLIGSHGRGARNAWIDIMIDNHDSLRHTNEGRTVDIAVADLYKNFGAVMAADGGVAAEVSNRIDASWSP